MKHEHQRERASGPYVWRDVKEVAAGQAAEGDLHALCVSASSGRTRRLVWEPPAALGVDGSHGEYRERARRGDTPKA